MKPSDLHVVAVFNNNRRWRSREALLHRFVDHMLASNVSLTIVEHVIGERNFLLAAGEGAMKHVNLIQIRGDAEHDLWLKEGLQKVGVRSLPENARFVAMIDADVFFQRADWAIETLDMLQVHRVGQPWSHAMDLGPDWSPIQDERGRDIDRSFCAAWVDGDIIVNSEDYGLGQPTTTWMRTDGKRDWRQHYGYAWAFRMETWNAIGGLPDWCVTGSADYLSSMAFAGKLSMSDAYTSPGAQRRLRRFAELCDQHVRQDIGVVRGLLTHGFHGTKKKRFYMDRKDILRESGFDPDIDLEYDRFGLPRFARDNRILRDGLRRLSVMRDEDSNAI